MYQAEQRGLCPGKPVSRTAPVAWKGSSVAQLNDRWDQHPGGGWAEFQAARRAQKDRMWVDTQLHRVLVDARRTLARERAATDAGSQIADATD
jgi:hypothetical protein